MRQQLFIALAGFHGALAADGEPGLAIDISDRLQTMSGFGLSQAFGSAATVQALDEETRLAVLDQLFDTTRGAGFSILRNRIGSGNGTGDSILPNDPGGPFATPDYSFDGSDSGQVWFSQNALEHGAVIIADAWSAPGFMKTNGDESNGGYLCGSPGHQCSSGDWRQAYANFLIQYLRFYAEYEIPITQLGFSNEPDLSVAYSSMLFDNAGIVDFIPILHELLKSSEFAYVGITCCDAASYAAQIEYTNALEAAGSTMNLSLIATHAYKGDIGQPMNTTLPVWMTELAVLFTPWYTGWYESGGPAEGFTWATKIHHAIVDSGLSAYVYWQGATVGADSSFLLNINGTEIEPSGRLWAITHWSRFVRPGAQRLAISAVPQGILASAYQNTDGSIIAVLINDDGPSEQSFVINVGDFTPSSVSTFLTDNGQSLTESTLSPNGSTVTVVVRWKGVVTVQLKA